MPDSIGDLRLEELLDAIADDSTVVASSAVAAATVAAAAGLAVMTAKRETVWAGAAAAAGQGEVLRRRATELIDESAEAFDAAVGELESARNPPSDPSAKRDWLLGRALKRAADAPLAVAEVAADTAALAAEVAAASDGSVRPDAVSACLLAESAAASAAHLVAVNLAAEADDKGKKRARSLSEAAARARADALALDT